MSPFRRRRRVDEDAPLTAERPPVAESAPDASEGAAERSEGGRGVDRGPWDVSEVPDLGSRLDFGALRIPGRRDMQFRMEVEKGGARVVAANLALGGSALQIQVFAAPRTTGIWEELRAELAASVTRQGGTADDVEGPFGPELLARLPVRTPDGRMGHRPARFIGVDGPRWFLRGVLTGRAAVDPGAAGELESVLADVVVVRGGEARAPRDLLELHLPGRPPAVAPVEPAPSPVQLRRGPEITEIR